MFRTKVLSKKKINTNQSLVALTPDQFLNNFECLPQISPTISAKTKPVLKLPEVRWASVLPRRYQENMESLYNYSDITIKSTKRISELPLLQQVLIKQSEQRFMKLKPIINHRDKYFLKSVLFNEKLDIIN